MVKIPIRGNLFLASRVHTLALFVPLVAMPNRIEAVVAWLYYLMCGVLAIPSFASFIVFLTTKPSLVGEICVWLVYVLLILGSFLPANKACRFFSGLGLVAIMVLAILGLMCAT